MKYYLGVDGGGTNTAFLLVNEHGHKIADSLRGTCYYGQIGYEGTQQVISNGILELCNSVGITTNDITASYIAVPGYGESQEAEIAIKKGIALILGNTLWQCNNDVLAAWAGSLALEPGINILAGTGSMAYGCDATGQALRCGGWGHFCGDEGSAYWLGKKLLELFSKQADYRLPRSHIYDIVRKELQLVDDFDIIDLTVVHWQAKRREIANLARLLYQAALLEDVEALRMYSEAARELVLHVKVLLDRLDFDQQLTIPVSWSGGVFEAGSILLEPLSQQLRLLNSKCVLKPPVLKPVQGAVLLAKQLQSTYDNEIFIHNLRQLK